MVMVVDIADIGIGWWTFWSYILVIKNSPLGRVFYAVKFERGIKYVWDFRLLWEQKSV